MEINLDNIKKVYVIGIKGSGVIAVVEILHSRGVEITGSDTSEKFFTDETLDRLGISYYEKFDPKNIPDDAEMIIYSTAYNEYNNEEMREAKNRGLNTISYPEVMADLFNKKFGIAVCGTHGKTTTSAWLANTLKEVGVEPTAAIGSKVTNWGSSAMVGQGEYFVAETDEYQDKLSLYKPQGVIFTSCDFDHPDYFEDINAYKSVFANFISKIPRAGFLVVWGDSLDTLEIAEEARSRKLTYGFNEENDIRIVNTEQIAAGSEIGRNFSISGQSFELIHGRQSLGKFTIGLFGKHNILNAAAVITACYFLNLDMEKARKGLGNFQGTSRRFEYVGRRKGAVLIDDYGHHPEEIKATLRAARELQPEKNIWAVFHPHTYTRTKSLLQEFSQSFDDADRVIVLDIYGSARENQGGVHSADLVNLINKYDRGKAEYVPTIKEAVHYLKDKIDGDDVVISIGAGNVWEVVDKLKEK